MSALLIVLGVALVLVLWFVSVYNGLVRLRNQVDNAWAQIDVQLKRRHDLIPNLINTVKGYMSHERDTLEAIVKARTAAMAATGPAQAGPAEAQLTGALRGLMVNVERYPDLKASASVLHLQRSLAEIEEQIAAARRFFNAAVTSYNDTVQSFPASLVAGAFGFAPRTWLSADAAERRRPNADFPCP